MLTSLSIRDVVLIESLDLTFSDGLSVLTGETGAGKSILLDSLGLALGSRADAGLVRKGAEAAKVTASFEVPHDHPAWAILGEQDIEAEDEALILRRQVSAEGRSRAYVNDQPVSVGLLRRLGDCLVEIQGHFEQRGLMDPGTHRALLDAYGGHAEPVGRLAAAWRAWKDKREALAEAERTLEQARRDEDYLRHAVNELESLDPQEGEEETLAERRALLMHASQVGEAMTAAIETLSGPAETALADARRQLESVADKAAGKLDPILATLERAMVESEEAVQELQSLGSEADMQEGNLEEVEERYFALKDLARKHQVAVDDLPALLDELSQRLTAIDGGEDRVSALRKEAETARAVYLEEARALSEARQRTAEALDKAIMEELAPLKLDKARFETLVEQQDESAAGPEGLDRVAFQVATNPGADPGAIGRIASAGELSRFLLALKVVLAEASPIGVLVFDEVDSGIGGATAAAVGERLSRLAEQRQVLVVTHSPQVAARGAAHWQVQKSASGAVTRTDVKALDESARREEIARMLAGAEITEEARRAAEKLIGTPA